MSYQKKLKKSWKNLIKPLKIWKNHIKSEKIFCSKTVKKFVKYKEKKLKRMYHWNQNRSVKQHNTQFKIVPLGKVQILSYHCGGVCRWVSLSHSSACQSSFGNSRIVSELIRSAKNELFRKQNSQVVSIVSVIAVASYFGIVPILRIALTGVNKEFTRIEFKRGLVSTG